MQTELLNTLAARGCKVAELLDETYCGNEPLMLRMVSKVPATTCLDRMEAAFAAKDAKDLFEASHELKGLYAVTALTPLFDKCCEIVEIARRGSLDGIGALLPPLRSLHAEFCAVIAGPQ